VAGLYDRVKQATMMQSDRPPALRQAIMACRNGGTVSVVGVYGGLLSKVPFGAVVNRGLTIKAGQTPVHRYLRPLLDRIGRGEIDPSFVITHRVSLDEVPGAFKAFTEKEDDAVKIVVKP
jgi:threonine dehydrogenase-like Zn-dependent dehydrogenase